MLKYSRAHKNLIDSLVTSRTPKLSRHLSYFRENNIILISILRTFLPQVPYPGNLCYNNIFIQQIRLIRKNTTLYKILIVSCATCLSSCWDTLGSTWKIMASILLLVYVQYVRRHIWNHFFNEHGVSCFVVYSVINSKREKSNIIKELGHQTKKSCWLLRRPPRWTCHISGIKVSMTDEGRDCYFWKCS